ncbi:S8 family serine peptidase [Streptomyces sp. NPDC007325]|uniref:S8 family peptidase n=1 Tax=Streptomyces sp. NPDC007325 TaxID=3154588 RepID=UPI0033D99F0A
MKRRRAYATATAVSLASLLSLGLSAPPVGGAPATDRTSGYLVVLTDAAGSPSAASGRQLRKVGGQRTAVYTHALKGYAATLTAAQAAELAEDPQVRFVSPQRTYTTGPPRKPATAKKTGQAEETGQEQARPADCESSPVGRQCVPEFVERVRADRSSARSGDGKGAVDVNVAVLDSGIDPGGLDLNVRGGVDCLSGIPVVPGLSLTDPTVHGTPVAGIIGARDNDRGLVGIAPGTPLWSVKIVDDEGFVDDAAFMCAMDWLVATRTDADPSNDIVIANMSIGSFPEDSAFTDLDDGACGTVNEDAAHMAVCRLVAVGITPVASAGNDRVDLAQVSPAAYDEVVTATAMADYDGRPGGREKPPVCYGTDEGFLGEADDLAALEFSNFARSRADRRHTVAAPGLCMEAAAPPPLHHAVLVGTSFAAPVTAGVLALCVHTGRCDPSRPARSLRTLVDDTRASNDAHPRHGFFGDPRRPIPGHYYGPLVAADRY